LSPETVISASIRSARFIRRSSMFLEKVADSTASVEKNPKLRANVQHDTRARRRAQLRVFGRRKVNSR
jgi:hypothetical protein